jgi:hypothetical protein
MDTPDELKKLEWQNKHGVKDCPLCDCEINEHEDICDSCDDQHFTCNACYDWQTNEFAKDTDLEYCNDCIDDDAQRTR